MDKIAVSDMTAKALLQKLADEDLLIHVHGGDKKLQTTPFWLMSDQILKNKPQNGRKTKIAHLQAI